MTASQRKLPRSLPEGPPQPTRTSESSETSDPDCQLLPDCQVLHSSAEKPKILSRRGRRKSRALRGNPQDLLNFQAFPGATQMTAKSTATALDLTQAPQMAAAIRALAMDAVQRAKSGHPGMPMGMAEIAVALWGAHLRHNPTDPRWPDRDRFVLSNGHGSMLLYSLLHL